MFELVRNRFYITSLVILVIGVLFRLALTENGNFLFNMDSARDFVDVREMMELQKIRLTGPGTAIDGLYNGPFWYYLLAIPYIISKGDPYSAILMQIGFWTIGGFFLLKLVKAFGILPTLVVGLLWIASDYIVLASVYSFNPTPVMFLTPVFIYLLIEYLKNNKTIYIALVWFLAGLFFNLEMNFGVFVPVIILTSIFLTKNNKLLRQKGFWIGVGCFILTLLPQIIFDIRHQNIMSKAVLNHLSANSSSNLNLLYRAQTVFSNFYNTFLPTLMSHKLLSWIILGLFIPTIYRLLKQKRQDMLALVSLIFVFVPFLGYLVLPVAINPWHLGAEMVTLLILSAYLLKKLMEGYLLSKITSIVLSLIIILFALTNITNFFFEDRGKPNKDPSAYKNEIAAIDYIYKYANGKNFKVYAYLPSIIDYPYQYLIWWYGLKQFGYLPTDYAYAPNKTPYISNKAAFSAKVEEIKKRADSNLVFLIKEPDRNYTRPGWEGDFVDLPSIDKKMIGPLEIDVRKETN